MVLSLERLSKSYKLRDLYRKSDCASFFSSIFLWRYVDESTNYYIMWEMKRFMCVCLCCRNWLCFRFYFQFSWNCLFFSLFIGRWDFFVYSVAIVNSSHLKWLFLHAFNSFSAFIVWVSSFSSFFLFRTINECLSFSKQLHWWSGLVFSKYDCSCVYAFQKNAFNLTIQLFMKLILTTKKKQSLWMRKQMCLNAFWLNFWKFQI